MVEHLVQKKLQQEIANTVYYNLDFLKPQGTSDQFFKQISYPVKLDDLYKVVDTCYRNQNFEFCPVLIQIVDHRLKDHYGGNFLLQVWDKQNQKVFEKILQFRIHSWNIFTNHFVFRLNPEEAGSEWIFLYDLKKKCSLLKIKDFLIKDRSYVHLGVCNSCFYIANSHTIKVVDINLALVDGGELIIEPTEENGQVATYQIGEQCKLHGFCENQFSKEQLYLLCLIETEDNQIDFARLYFWSRIIEKADFSFIQYAEVVHRDVKLDPIRKIRSIYNDKEFQFGMALRESGLVDFYWNSSRVSTTEEAFTDIEINFKSMYLIRRDGTKLEIGIKWDNRVSLEVAEEVTLSKKDWDKLFFQSIRTHFQLYPSYCLINTSFFLAHGNIISLFDIIKKMWVKHFPFEEKVIKVFRNEKSEHEYNLGVYLDNGKIKLIDSSDTTNPELWEMTNNKYATQGTLLSMGGDQEHYRMIYMLTNDQGTINLYGFTRETLYLFNTLVHDLREDTIIIPFFSPEERTEFILYNSEPGDIRIYTHYWENETFYLTLQKQYSISQPSGIEGNIHTAMTTDKEKYLFLVDDKNFYKLDALTSEVNVYPDQNVKGIQFLDNTYCYTMSNDSSKRGDCGFYVYDIQQLLDQDRDNNFLLDRALVGASGLIDFSSDNQRLSYMQDYDMIQIVPSLHRNVINFMGMLDRSQYLATKKLKDKFIALDKRNVLTTWNSVTGKLEQVHKLKDVDLSSYNIYSYEIHDITNKMDWYQPRALLKQVEAITNMNDEQFFDAEMLRTSLENNQPYIKVMKKTFHNYKMIEIVNEYEVKELFTFVHPYYGDGSYQRIYFSQDTKYMLERLQNQRVFLYEKEKSMFGRVKWRMIRRITNWPMDISELTHANYLVSPDLMYYLDYDRQKNEFVIKETLTQRVKLSIPKGLMNPSEGDVKDYVMHFKWIDSSTIKLINKEGIEKIIDIDHGFKEIAFCAVPLFKEIKQKGYQQYYYLRPSLEIGETSERLKMKYQQFKSAYYLEGKREPWQLYDSLFSIDYSVDSCSYKYVIDLSFTFLHWKLAETIKNSHEFSLDDIDNSQIEKLVYNIFPLCNTVLHYSSMRNTIVKQIYSYSEAKDQEFEVPFLMNIEGKSPMHLCMDHKEYKTADFLYYKLSSTPIDHHGRALVGTLSQAIENGLENVDIYLNSRFKQTEQIHAIRRGCLNIKGSLKYVCSESQVWMDVKEIEKALLKPSPVESDIKLEFFDLPQLHCYGNDVSEKFFEALSNTDTIDLFANRGVQTVIDYKWRLVKEYTIRRLFVPFVVFMILYFSYSNFIFVERFHETPQEREVTQSFDIAFYVLAPLIIIASTYFFVTEIKQLISSGLEYFTSIWNYFDLLPPIIIPLIILQDFLGLRYDFVHSLHALASLFMWFKFLYFLRIFKETGYLIRMIVEVIKDMKIFFIVLIVVLSGFADAFLSLSNANPEDGARFAGADFFNSLLYTYRTSLGDFQVDDFNNSAQYMTVWIIFLLSSILVLIVMLNLLIAIISESFAKINSVATQASYQERARIISENGYLIPQARQLSFADDKKYMLVAREIELNEDAEDRDEEVEAIEKLKTEFTERIDSLERNFTKKLDEIIALVKKEKEDISSQEEQE